MRRLALALVSVVALVGLSFAAPKARTFTGEIMDSQCAMNGSHAQMEKMNHMPDDPKACTLKCVSMGGKFVLYNAATKATYQLDDQDRPKRVRGPESESNRHLRQGQQDDSRSVDTGSLLKVIKQGVREG